ncbi:MAG: MFS transporter, partial [Frankiaceae bacterium]|nr:MFS transporter [Frankiaceae bacterium]
MAGPATEESERDAGAAADRGGMFRSLRVRNYRLYAGGQIVATTGMWMQRVAIDWLVLNLSQSGTVLGLVTMLQFGPTLVLGPFGGLLADRVSKRKLQICTNAGVSACATVLGILELSGWVRLWQVIVVAACLGVISAIDAPGRQSFVVEMVGPGDLQNAVALNSAIFNSGRLLGPSIGGAVIAGVGTGWAFMGNSLFTLAAIAALLLMRSGELAEAPLVERGKGQLREGARYVAAHRSIWATIALAGVVGVFGMNLQLICAMMAKQVFHGGATTYARLSTALAVGAFVGALAAARRAGRPSVRRLARLALVFGAGEIVLGLMPNVIATGAAMIVVGFFMITLMTSANAAVQLGIAPMMRGRVMAIYMMCSMGGSSLGGPVVGHVAQVYGARTAVIAGGIA